MGNIYGKFSDQDPIIVSGQAVAANNNLTALNSAILETDQVRSTKVALQPDGLLISPGAAVPNVAQALQGDIGAALGDIGQQGTASQEPGGGGIPCFLGSTLFTLLFEDYKKIYVPMSRLYGTFRDGVTYPRALSFDKHNLPVPGEIVQVFRKTWHDYLHVTFADGSADDVVAEHRYFTPDKVYIPIKDLMSQKVVGEDGTLFKVVGIDEVHCEKGISVYNAHIKDHQNYCANKRRVHNLKPLN